MLTALSLWLYAPTLFHLVVQWWRDPDFSHGFFVPVFSAFVLWQGRTRLVRLPPRPAWTGLAILAFALVTLVIGQMGAELFLARSSLLLLLAGIVVLFLGWGYLRAVLFPFAFLILMIPIPAIVFNQLTFPLQLLASRVAAAILPWMGVPVLREGNVIVLPAMAHRGCGSLQRNPLPHLANHFGRDLWLPDGKTNLGPRSPRSRIGAHCCCR